MSSPLNWDLAGWLSLVMADCRSTHCLWAAWGDTVDTALSICCRLWQGREACAHHRRGCHRLSAQSAHPGRHGQVSAQPGPQLSPLRPQVAIHEGRPPAPQGQEGLCRWGPQRRTPGRAAPSLLDCRLACACSPRTCWLHFSVALCLSLGCSGASEWDWWRQAVAWAGPGQAGPCCSLPASVLHCNCDPCWLAHACC